MAKVDTQNIPSELLDLYRAALGEERPDHGVRKRYPYRVPTMQTETGHPSTKQKTQRTRFNDAVQKFNATSWPDRQRWYDAMPPWGSLLWYYDYFILSALMGDAYINSGGLGVIKSIQVVKQSVPTTGGSGFVINAVDPAKTVVMLYGNSYISDKVQRGTAMITDGGTNYHALSPKVNVGVSEVRIVGSGGKQEIDEGSGSGDWQSPYAYALIPAQLAVRMQPTVKTITCGYSWEVIERLAQTIFPVIVSIAAELITIDWAKVPSVAADVSIIVIEYI